MSGSKKTRIGFDLRPLQEGFKAHKWRGIGVCTRNWAERFDLAPASLELVPFYDPCFERKEAKSFGAEVLTPGWMTEAVGPALSEFVRQNTLLGRDLDSFAQEKALDFFYFPSHLDVPAGLTTPYIATAHDMIYSAMMERFYRSFKRRISAKAQITALQKAQRIITVSENSKKDVMRYASIEPDTITVVPNGVDEAFRPDSQAVTTRFALPEKFILNVGGIDWRKNVDLLFSAFAKALQTDPDLHLVMTGDIAGDDRYRAFRAELEKSRMTHRIITPGFVAQEELIALYNRAIIFFYPSVYEGFGLPLLEAMACGTPVITTNRSAIPEVVGDAAVTLDPDDPEAFGDALIDLLADAPRRKALAEAGVSQAAKFSWRRSATAIFATLEKESHAQR